MSRQSLFIAVVGLIWQGQECGADLSVPMWRPLTADEAADAVAQIKAELLARSAYDGIPGLIGSRDFGDFQTITDVRIVYSSERAGQEQGLLGPVTTLTHISEVLIDFTNPDSHNVTGSFAEDN